MPFKKCAQFSTRDRGAGLQIHAGAGFPAWLADTSILIIEGGPYPRPKISVITAKGGDKPRPWE
jgi:hypothetical protein